jgi:hypothetical protein
MAKGGFAPGNYARIFDTANPGSRAKGTPNLASPDGIPPIGNVLIVQSKNQNQPQASDTGVITFVFANPIDEVFEIGLLNVENYVYIYIKQRR